MFKNGEGVLTVFDQDYGAERNFQLLDGAELLEVLERQGLTIVQADTPDQGGFLYFTDGKGVDHSLFFSRKQAAIP